MCHSCRDFKIILCIKKEMEEKKHHSTVQTLPSICEDAVFIEGLDI